MEKKFTKFTIATIKRTAQNVYPLVRKKNKLKETVEAANQEIAELEAMIDTYQTPVKMATGGYTTEDLIDRVVTATDKKDKDGNIIKMTQYVLKYPDTVVPPKNEEQPAELSFDNHNLLSNNNLDALYEEVAEETHGQDNDIDLPFNIN